METKLTKEQQEAISNRGGSILVSAAAGSGKTFVLVNRLLDYVEKEYFDVDNFLLITFTKAAANEMKTKIAEEISKRLTQSPTNKHLQNQLFKVYKADIKTIDSFCVQILRENIHLLEIDEKYSYSPDFSIIDEQEATILKNQCIDEVLEEFYKDLTPEKKRMVDTLGYGRDDRDLKNIVLEVFSKLQAHPYPEKWLKRICQEWDSIGKTSIQDSKAGSFLMDYVVNRSSYWASVLREAANIIECNENVFKNIGIYFLDVANQLDCYKEARKKGWNAMKAVSLTFPKSGRIPECEEKNFARTIWNLCKEELMAGKKNVIGNILNITENEAKQDLLFMAPVVCELMKLVSHFINVYSMEKLKKNLMDFSDQEHYVLKLLIDEDGNKTDLAQTISKRYHEIMIDEYQDTNEIQNEIYKAVSKDNSNLFCVGDVKQSIYRFRLADPSIFLQAYHSYVDVFDAKGNEPRKILLSKNFRSRDEVIEATNYICSRIMSKDFGGVDYKEDEKLVFGQTNFTNKSDCRTEFHYLLREKDENDKLKDRLETEASFVAHEIQKLVATFQVQDTDGCLRQCRYEDIVILMRSPKNRLKTFSSVFARYGIPCGIDEDNHFFESLEITVLFSLLKVVDNPHQDIPLISVLRSPLFQISEDQIAKVRGLNKKGDLFDALTQSTDAEIIDFLSTIQQLRYKAKECSVDELIWYIFDSLHVNSIFGLMDGGIQRKRNLVIFYSYAKDQAKNGKRSLFEFVSYLSKLIECGKTPTLTTRQNSDGVKIMTIHKSKGLEFPVVFICDLDKKMNMEDARGKVLLDLKCGVGIKGYNLEKKYTFDTISKKYLSLNYEADMKAEELRLLYVAMTRAKEKLILVDCPEYGEKKVSDLSALALTQPTSQAYLGQSSFGDWILLSSLGSSDSRCLYQTTDYPDDFQKILDTGISFFLHRGYEPAHIPETSAQVFNNQSEEIDLSLLDSIYPYEKVVTIPKKRIATQFKGRAIDEDTFETIDAAVKLSYYDKPNFLKSETSLSATEKGVATHLILQYIRFFPQNEETVRSQINQMLSRHIITQPQADAINIKSITELLNSQLGKRIAQARKVIREFKFSILEDSKIFNHEVAGEEMLLQGIIDLAFFEGNHIIVVDFKTDQITKVEEHERSEYYRGQLSLYAHCLEKIFNCPVSEKILYFLSTGAAVAL